MKIWHYGIIVCLCSIVLKGVCMNVTSHNGKNAGKNLNIGNMYDNDKGDVLHDQQTIQSAEVCKCDKGKCVEENGKLVCTCPPEFGVYKFGPKVECRPCNCGKESNCTMEGKMFSTTVHCICKDGYKAVKNFCQGPCTVNPCKNGGTCADVNKTFKCICPSEYTGKLCEMETSCSSNPCQNDGTCSVQGTSFKCDCKTPYYGDQCEKDCECKNGGICLSSGTDEKMECLCQEPFRGPTCEEDPCHPNLCENNHTCEVLESSYTCNCIPPYGGINCEEIILDCDCGENGKCTFIGEVQTCICDMGFSTKEDGKCLECDCGDNGKCTFIRDLKTCTCNEDFSAKDGKCYECDCGGNGICNFVEDYKTCTCDKGFSERDDGRCYECDCGENGRCNFVNGIKTCTCNKGFSENKDGKCSEMHTCEKEKPCKNGGECLENGRDYFCLCKDGLAGKNCTESNWCLHTGRETCINVPCVYDSQKNISFCECEHSLLFNVKSKKCEPCYCGDNGTCLSENEMKTCICDENYIEKDGICFEILTSTSIPTTFTPTTGTRPDCNCGVKSIDCKLDYRGRKKCFCVTGFAQKGSVCTETCSSHSDCYNGGTCEQEDDAFFCVCPKDYAGDRCQVNAACDAIRRRCDAMRAVCRMTRDGAVCECPPEKAFKGFSGVCEDICDSKKCKNGKCEITGKSFKCICDEGFTGLRCDEKITKKEVLPVYIIGITLLSAAVLLLIIVTLGLSCVIRRLTKVNKIQRY